MLHEKQNNKVPFKLAVLLFEYMFVSVVYMLLSSLQMKETNGDDSTTSQMPPIEPSTCNSANSQDENQSGASTPPEQTPPLVPAPTPDPASSVLTDPEDLPRPAHVMAEVRVRSAPHRERVVRGMQDSKSLDGISNACGGGTRTAAGRGGQAEGRRATISSALELEGTVSHEGDLTNFITENLEQKIKMSSRPSLDSDCKCAAQNLFYKETLYACTMVEFLLTNHEQEYCSSLLHNSLFVLLHT